MRLIEQRRLQDLSIRGLLAGIYTDQKICWEDAEGGHRVIEKESKVFLWRDKNGNFDLV